VPSFKLKSSWVTILQGVEFSIFLLILAWALQQCSANVLPVIIKIILGNLLQRERVIRNEILCHAVAGGYRTVEKFCGGVSSEVPFFRLSLHFVLDTLSPALIHTSMLSVILVRR